MSRSSPRHQRGAALFVVLVLMLVMVWFAISAFRIGSQGVQIVGNTQVEQQATAAAQRAIDVTISSNEFAKDPAGVAAVPIQTDIDGDGTNDYTANLQPQPKCIRVRPLKTSELANPVTSPAAYAKDKSCLTSTGATGNLIIAPGSPVTTGDSNCASSEWDVAAAVTDARSSAAVSIHQGVGIRVLSADALNFCK